VGFQSQDGLVVVACVDELKGQFFGEGHVLEGVVGVEGVLGLDLSVYELFLEVGGSLPGLSEVEVHFSQHLHVLFLQHLLELPLVRVLLLVVLQLLLPVLLEHLLGLEGLQRLLLLGRLEGGV
jgi:hypothetical protein